MVPLTTFNKKKDSLLVVFEGVAVGSGRRRPAGRCRLLKPPWNTTEMATSFRDIRSTNGCPVWLVDVVLWHFVF